MLELAAGFGIIIGVLVALVLVWMLRMVLVWLGLTAVILGTFLMAGQMVVPGPDATWPALMTMIGFAACLPAIIADL